MAPARALQLPSFSSPPHFPSLSFLPCSTQLQCLLEASRFHAHLHRTDVQAMQTPVTKLGWGIELRAGCPPMPPDSPLLSSGFSLAQYKPCTPPEPGRATLIPTGEPNPIQILPLRKDRTPNPSPPPCKVPVCPDHPPRAWANESWLEARWMEAAAYIKLALGGALEACKNNSIS